MRCQVSLFPTKDSISTSFSVASSIPTCSFRIRLAAWSGCSRWCRSSFGRNHPAGHHDRCCISLATRSYDGGQRCALRVYVCHIPRCLFLDVKVVKRLVSSRGLAHHLAKITKETGGFGH